MEKSNHGTTLIADTPGSPKLCATGRQEESTSVGMSRIKRFAVTCLACSHILLASGEAYGWTALAPVLEHSGIFDAVDDIERTKKMNAVATMGIAANAVCKFPLGLILDRFGPRVTSCFGALIMILGCGLMAMCDKNDQAMLITGYFAIGMSGPFLMMPCCQFSELFGTRKSSVMATFVTCFEISTGVFSVFEVLNHRYPSLDRKTLFLGYGAVGVYAFITALLFWPDVPFRASPPPPPAVSNDMEANDQPETSEEMPIEETHSTVRLKDQSFQRQLFSTPFLYVLFFMTIHVFRQGFVLATVGQQVEHFFGQDEKLQRQLTTSFNVMLPLGFVPMFFLTLTGISAYLLDRPKFGFVAITLLSMVYGLLLLVPVQWAFLAVFLVFPVARQLVFSMFFSYSANIFGYATFGRITGMSPINACILQLASVVEQNTYLSVDVCLISPSRYINKQIFAMITSTIAGLIQLSQTKILDVTTHPTSDFSWFEMNLVLGTIPVVLLAYPMWTSITQVMRTKVAGDDESTGSESEISLALFPHVVEGGLPHYPDISAHTYVSSCATEILHGGEPLLGVTVDMDEDAPAVARAPSSGLLQHMMASPAISYLASAASPAMSYFSSPKMSYRRMSKIAPVDHIAEHSVRSPMLSFSNLAATFDKAASSFDKGASRSFDKGASRSFDRAASSPGLSYSRAADKPFSIAELFHENGWGSSAKFRSMHSMVDEKPQSDVALEANIFSLPPSKTHIMKDEEEVEEKRKINEQSPMPEQENWRNWSRREQLLASQESDTVDTADQESILVGVLPEGFYAGAIPPLTVLRPKDSDTKN